MLSFSSSNHDLVITSIWTLPLSTRFFRFVGNISTNNSKSRRWVDKWSKGSRRKIDHTLSRQQRVLVEEGLFRRRQEKRRLWSQRQEINIPLLRTTTSTQRRIQKENTLSRNRGLNNILQVDNSTARTESNPCQIKYWDVQGVLDVLSGDQNPGKSRAPI